MGIVNRRNAVIGWSVWQIAKRIAALKAKDAVPTINKKTKRPNKPAIAAAALAVGGLLLFWRKKGDELPPGE
jgi:hypothetical protein